ncbi:MAG: hypothetical protein HC769_17905 [Cyanobacteria bacterium CRU_2_1]|nr:hypothetical protein [Cyanobacteria bacterium RU_5_0]NJR60543.1 hypothetical protein [Cyanobacteria bacterium CRU_2_1]
MLSKLPEKYIHFILWMLATSKLVLLGSVFLGGTNMPLVAAIVLGECVALNVIVILWLLQKLKGVSAIRAIEPLSGKVFNLRIVFTFLKRMLYLGRNSLWRTYPVSPSRRSRRASSADELAQRYGKRKARSTAKERTQIGHSLQKVHSSTEQMGFNFLQQPDSIEEHPQPDRPPKPPDADQEAKFIFPGNDVDDLWESQPDRPPKPPSADQDARFIFPKSDSIEEHFQPDRSPKVPSISNQTRFAPAQTASSTVDHTQIKYSPRKTRSTEQSTVLVPKQKHHSTEVQKQIEDLQNASSVQKQTETNFIQKPHSTVDHTQIKYSPRKTRSTEQSTVLIPKQKHHSTEI